MSAVLACLVVPQLSQPAQAVQGIPYQINFQGRLADATGAALADGSYNIKFRIWDATTSGTNLWEEDRVMTGTDNRITVTNGLFSVQFGTLTALPASVFSTSASRYLEIELPSVATATCATNGCPSFTEGAFTPRQPLASSPYAYNSDTLDGLDSAAFAQLSSAQTFSDTNTFSKSGGAGIVLSGSPASGGALLQMGSALASGNTNGTLIGANTALTGDLINLQVSGATKLKVDNSGNLTLASGTTITIGATAGVGTTCSGGQVLQNQTTAGGIVTGGTCAVPAGTGANLTLSNLGVTSINADLLPSANNTRVLGSATLAWSGLFAANIDTGTTTTALTVGTTNAASITIGKAGLPVTAPGGLSSATGSVQLGSTSGTGVLQVERATYTSNLVLINDGTTGAPPAFPNSYTPALTVVTSEVSGSRPLFFGYKNGAGTAYDGFLTSGACAAFTQMCLDMGTGSTAYTALENIGTTLQLGGGDDGNFTQVLFKNSGNTGIGVTTANYKLDVAGDINTSTAYRVGGTTGATTTCSGSQVLLNPVTSGGITTGGTCTAASSIETLQNTYDNSSAPANITLATGKNLVVTSPDVATDANIVFNLQCTTCSAGGGQFSVQDNGSDIMAALPSGAVNISPTNGSNFALNIGASSQMKINSATAPTVDQLVIDNTASAGVATAGVNGANIKYKGGAAAVEASGMRIDYAPGTTSAGIWSGMRIVAGATGAVTGVTEYGLKLEGPTAPGAGTEVANYIGTGWDIGADIQSGGMQLAQMSDPTAPAASNLRVYSQDIAGRTMFQTRNNGNVATPLQTNLGFNRTAWAMPGYIAVAAVCTAASSTASGTLPVYTAATATCLSAPLASTNLMTSIRRIIYNTTATAGIVASQRQSQTMAWRGNAAGAGGFFYTTRFGLSTLAAGERAFVGLNDLITAQTNIDPTTSTANSKVGMAINTNTGNWNIISNIAGTAPTSTALGANFPVNTTNMYELVLYSAPNGSSIGYRVTNLSTGSTVSNSFTGATVIPANTTFLAPQMWVTNNATAGAATIDWAGWYLESDN